MRMRLPPHRRFRTLADWQREDALRRHLHPVCMLPGLAPVVIRNAAAPGLWSQATAGAWSFTVPEYGLSLTIELWGGGGNGPSYTGTFATDGGNTTCPALSLVAGGGKAGTQGSITSDGSGDYPTAGNGGSGGIASGGDVNTSGNNGFRGDGGGLGGVAVAGLDASAGAGGGGGPNEDTGGSGTGRGPCGGGGSGGYLRKTFPEDAILPGTVISGTIGSAGSGYGSPQSGRVIIRWS